MENHRCYFKGLSNTESREGRIHKQMFRVNYNLCKTCEGYFLDCVDYVSGEKVSKGESKLEKHLK